MELKAPHLCTALILMAIATANAGTSGSATPHPAQNTIAPADDISAPPRKAGAAAKATPTAPTSSSSTGKDRVLWDHWYTVTVNKVIHYQYYNERTELKGGRITLQNHAWKQEEDFINEEQLGVFAQYNEIFTPLFFNFHSTYRSVETTIDGTVKDGKELVVHVRKGSTELPIIKKMIPHKAFFSELFPIWLGSKLQTFKIGQVYPFMTVLEDNLESEFTTINGQIRVEPSDDFANTTHTTKVTVNFREMKSTWWVDASGAAVRIDMPLQKTVVMRVPKDTATKFLDEGG